MSEDMMKDVFGDEHFEEFLNHSEAIEDAMQGAIDGVAECRSTLETMRWTQELWKLIENFTKYPGMFGLEPAGVEGMTHAILCVIESEWFPGDSEDAASKRVGAQWSKRCAPLLGGKSLGNASFTSYAKIYAANDQQLLDYVARAVGEMLAWSRVRVNTEQERATT